MREYEKKRLYDESLVTKMKLTQYTTVENGVEILCKLPPEGERAHLDCRLKNIIEYKKKAFANRAKSGWTLSGERYRPDKVTYDLTTTQVTREERLIPINKTHKINAYIYRAEQAKADCPVLVYLHGGGFTAGDVGLFECQMKYIAEQSKAVVVFPEYRLAPECPFPVEDAWGTVQWVHEYAKELGVNPKKLMIAGDSAGGSLANACALLDTQGIIRKIMGIYSLWDGSDDRKQEKYPWSYEQYEITEEECELAYSRIDRIKNSVETDADNSFMNLYMQNHATAKEPLISAVFAKDSELKKFPEAVFVTAEYDYLRVGSDYAAAKLKQLGVPVRSIRYCGCDHGFLDMIGTIVQAEELCLTIAGELNIL